MRILLIEDDRMIGESLVRGLRDDGYTVDWVSDGVAAEAALLDRQADYALALLDWGLPRQDGLAVLKAARRAGVATPLLMLTARDALDDRVAGLDAGADDYLVKPFELAELKARMRSLLRRREGRAASVLTHGEFALDPAGHTLTRAGLAIALTAREFALLRVLMERPTMVWSRRQLEEQIYGWDCTVESNTVEVLIHGLRRKLGSTLIDNVRGVGWRLGAVP